MMIILEFDPEETVIMENLLNVNSALYLPPQKMQKDDSLLPAAHRLALKGLVEIREENIWDGYCVALSRSGAYLLKADEGVLNSQRSATSAG